MDLINSILLFLGLPHVHILLILAEPDKPKCPEDVDRLVCAELPDRHKNPRLFDVITRHNIHGPCGAVNNNSPCMTGEGLSRCCGKGFPKPFTNRTSLTDSSYPLYSRRAPDQGGRVHFMTVRGQQFTVDNSWVVPYNPLLSLKYNSHINVEVVHSVSAVKYLYKYITKGNDRVMFRLSDGREVDITNDEIERYVLARYISASEAYWRLYDFTIHFRYPPVMKLPVHLEGEQTVLFDADRAQDAADAGPPTTKLTDWFRLNAEDSNARTILYPDLPKHYTWNHNKWQRRKRVLVCNQTDDDCASDMIGRIPVIGLSAHQNELYYLRMLLYHQVGATCYADLRRVDGEEMNTYQAACLRLGLLDDDQEIDRAMEEAAGLKFGNQLRELFVNILMWVRPVDPRAFYDRHKLALRDDFKRMSPEEAENETLIFLQDRLSHYDLELKRDFGLPQPSASNRIPAELRDELAYDIGALTDLHADQLGRLTAEQRCVYDAVVDSVDSNKGALISLDACGGTGKTFTLTTILAFFRSRGYVALATAASGIAATLLPNGRTLHSRLKVLFITH